MAACARGASPPPPAVRLPDVELKSEIVTIEAQVPPHATLDALLRDQQLAAPFVTAAIEAARAVFNPRQLHSDRHYRLVRSLDGMVPMNLLSAQTSADYIVTGAWSQKAVKEAKRVGGAKIAASTESENFARIPRQQELKLDPGAAYVHYTTNNTIFGTEFNYVPDVGSVPLVADASSDIFSGPIDVPKFGLIYAGAQKNLAPAGLTLVIVRDDLVKRTPSSLPTMLQYGVHAENKSMYNTPPVFAIYIMRLVLAWLIKQGGLAAIDRRNARKADKLYAEIDRTGFYRGHASKDSRSRMREPEAPADDPAVPEQFLDLMRMRRSANVEILRPAIEQQVANAAANQVRDVVMLVKSVKNFERVRIDVAAGDCMVRSGNYGGLRHPAPIIASAATAQRIRTLFISQLEDSFGCVTMPRCVNSAL